MSAIRPFTAPILWTLFIGIPVASWGWLNGAPLGRLEAAAVALVWWAWTAGRSLPGVRLAAVLCIAKIVVGGAFVERGLTAQYYANDAWAPPIEGSAEFHRDAMTRVDERVAFGAAGQPDLPLYFFNDLRFNFYRPADPQEDRLAYSARWQGYIRQESSQAPAQFYLDVAPALSGEVAIDGRVVVEVNGATRRIGSIVLSEGWHALTVRVKAPYGSGRRVEAGQIVGGQRRPFDRSQVLVRPVASTRLALDSALRFAARLIDVIVLSCLALVVSSRARRAWSDRHVGRLLFLAAIAEAVIHSWGYAGRMVVMLGGDDWLMYESYARAIALGDVIGAGQKGVFFTQPLYPYILALVHVTFGDSLFGVVFVQRLLLAAAVGWVAAMTTRLFGRHTGRIALVGGGIFLYIKVGRWTDFLLTELVFLPLLAGWIAMLVKSAAEGASALRTAAAGALGGVITLIRSTLLLAWPPVVILWWASLGRRRWRMAAVLLVTMLAAFSMTAMRNWIVARQLVFGPTNFAVTLSMGNEPAHPLNPAPPERSTLYDRFELDVNIRNVLEYAVQAPAAFVGGLGRKALYTMGFFGWSRLPGGIGTSWWYVGVWALATAGVARILRGALPATSPAVWLPAAAALSHFAVMVLVIPFGYTDRYIIPMYPLLIPYAAFGAEPLPRVMRRLDARLRPVAWRAQSAATPYLRATQRTARQVVGRVIAPLLRRPLYWLSLGYAAAAIQALEWQPEDGDAVSIMTALLFPVAALAGARLTQRTMVYRAICGLMFAAALIYVGVRGSLSPIAVHDPLFWAAIAALSFAASALVNRWRTVAFVAAALAGGCTIVSLLLPVFPEFASTFPELNAARMRESLAAVTGHLGATATIFMAGLWVHAMTAAPRRAPGAWQAGAATTGALIAALLLVLAGAVTRSRIEPAWFAALGLLVGLAESRAAVKSPPPTST